MFAAQTNLIDKFGSIIGGNLCNCRLRAICSDAKVALREDNEPFSRNIIFLDCFTDDLFGDTMAIYVCLYDHE